MRKKIWITGQKRLEWANDAQHECYQLLADLVGGTHHIYYKVKPFSDYGIETVLPNSIATYDFAMMTRLVILAHDRCIRAEIAPGGRWLKLYLHKRKREGFITQRHPTIEDAILNIRK